MNSSTFYETWPAYVVGQYVRTARGLVRIDKALGNDHYNVTLDRVVNVKGGSCTNMFVARVVPKLVIIEAQRID